MKIVVTEMPESAWNCPFVKDSQYGCLHTPLCGLSPNKDDYCGRNFNVCSLTDYNEDYTEQMDHTRCDCLVLMSMK